MRVEVARVAEADKPLLWRQLQDYIVGMLPYVNFGPKDGDHDYPPFDLYWREANRWPFWAMADGERAGFALVLREDGGNLDMVEFYIRPEFRRAGVGLEFARALLKRFPGTWILSEYRANDAAIAFWHRAIEGYIFTERTYVGGQGKERLEQRVVVPDI
jgi:predicted acetyltransferase